MSDAYVWIDPARRSGEPCIGGHRLPVEMVVDAVWSAGVAQALGLWPQIDRAQVLVACWYAGAGNVVRLHGKGGKYVAHRGPWRKRWGTWAKDSHQALWEQRFDDVTDPPSANSSARAPGDVS